MRPICDSCSSTYCARPYRSVTFDQLFFAPMERRQHGFWLPLLLVPIALQSVSSQGSPSTPTTATTEGAAAPSPSPAVGLLAQPIESVAGSKASQDVRSERVEETREANVAVSSETDDNIGMTGGLPVDVEVLANPPCELEKGSQPAMLFEVTEASEPSACCWICVDNVGCVAFNFRPSTRECVLLGEVRTPRANPGWVTGTIVG